MACASGEMSEYVSFWKGICRPQKSFIQKSKVLSKVAVSGNIISSSESNSVFLEWCGSTEEKKKSKASLSS